MLYGVDVSKWQLPALIPTAVDFVIARATYGNVCDKRAAAHVARGRELGAKVGLYAFFTLSSAPSVQVNAFQHTALQCGLDTGDIIPWIDIETIPSATGPQAPRPDWNEYLRPMVDMLTWRWGECGLYLNPTDFQLLGSPAWILGHPLWLANWCGQSVPSFPGKVTIHQYRVAPYDRFGNGGTEAERKLATAIDHDRAPYLPLIDLTRDLPLIDQGKEVA